MGIMAKLKEAKAGGSGPRNYLSDGDYIIRVNRVEFATTRKKGNLFGADGKIAKILENPKNDMRVGQTFNWATFETWDSYWSHVKGFVVAILGVEESDFNALSEKEGEELLESIHGKEQVAAGRYLRVEVRSGPTKNGGTFSNHRWEHLTEEQVKKFLGDEAVAAAA